MEDENSGFANLLLTLFTSGWRTVLIYYIKNRPTAKKLLAEQKKEFPKYLGNAIVEAMEAEQAPFGIIDKKVREFFDAFHQPTLSFQKLKKEIETDLERAEGNRELMDALAEQIESGSRLLEQGRGLLKECEAFCAKPA